MPKFKLLSILFSSVFFAVLFLFPFSQTHADIVNGLISHWKLDETTGTVAADSAGSKNGTLTNGPTWTVGKFNNALNFDGVNDYVSLPSQANTNAYTQSAWVYMRSSGGYIFSNEQADLYWCNTASTAVWVTRIGSSCYSTRDDLTFPALTANQWTHLVFVYDGVQNIKRIYKNGVLSASKTPSHGVGSLALSGKLHFIGDSNDGATFNGIIDEVRIYNRVLSATDVTELYNYTGSGSSSSSQLFPLTSSSSQTQSSSSSVQPALTITTNSATSITSTSAVLNATVNNNGLTAIAWFEYGLTTAYGNQTPTQTISDLGNISISSSISGLSSNTVYYYRVAAQSNGGTAYGQAQSFTTAIGTQISASSHPFLIVKENMYPSLQARASQSPWKEMKSDSISTVNSTNYDTSGSIMTKAGQMDSIVSAGALAYILDPANKTAYKNKVRDTLNYWNDLYALRNTDWEFVVRAGLAFFNSVLAFDVIYNDLTAAEQSNIQSKLSNVGEWYLSTSLSWPENLHPCRGIWALWKNNRSQIDAAKLGYRKVFNEQINPDGVFNEGSGYSGDLASLTTGRYFMDILEHTGEDYSYYTDPEVIKFQEWYNGYSKGPFGQNYSFGDTFLLQGADSAFAGIYRAYRFSDKAGKYASWLAQVWSKPSGRLLNYILADKPLSAPEKAPSRIFTDGGAWFHENNQSTASLSGALWNIKDNTSNIDAIWHRHKEINAIYLFAYGEHILRNSGYNGASSGALGYSRAYIHNTSWSGNTVNIDGTDHQFKTGNGIVEGWTGGYFDYALGDSGTALPNGKHLRSLVFVHPQDGSNGYFVLFDEVDAGDTSNTINVALHPNSDLAPIITNGAEYKWKVSPYRLGQQDVYLTIFLGTQPKSSVINSGVLASGSESFVGKYLYSTYSADTNGNRNIVSVLYPHDATHAKADMSRLTGSNYSGASIDHGNGSIDYALESQGSAMVNVDKISFRGLAALYRFNADKNSFYFVRKGTSFNDGSASRRGFSSSSNISLYMKNTQGKIVSPGTNVTFYYPGITGVSIDGQYKAGTTVYVSAGTHEVSLNTGTLPTSYSSSSSVSQSSSSVQSSSSSSVTQSSSSSSGNFSQVWQQVPVATKALRAYLESKGITPAGGEGMQFIHALAYAPSNPNVAYLGVDTDTIWKSTDGGTTWKRKAKGIGSNGIVSITVDPNNENRVFVTGAQYHGYWALAADKSKSPLGIYRTLDGGENWTLVKRTYYGKPGDYKRFGANLIAFAGNTIYAGTEKDGLLKSTDGGDTWTTVVAYATIGRIFDVDIHPTDNSIIYVGSINGLKKVTSSGAVTSIGSGLTGPAVPLLINPQNPLIMFAGDDSNKIMKSTDGGVTFTASFTQSNTWQSTAWMAMSPVDPNYVFVSFGQRNWAEPQKDFYYTQNGSASSVTWQTAQSMDEKNQYGWVAGSLDGDWPDADSWSEYFGGPIAMHPTNKNTALYFAGPGVIKKTTDGGANWRYSNAGFTALGSQPHSLLSFDKSKARGIGIANTDRGLYFSDDNGYTFSAFRLPRWPVASYENRGFGIAVGWGSTEDVIVGVVGAYANNIITVSKNKGSTWAQITGTAGDYEGKLITFSPTNSNVIYAGSWRSIDGGTTWTKLSRSVDAVYWANGDIVYSIGYVSGGNVNISKSIDRGATWTSPYPEIPTSFSNVMYMAVSPTNPDKIYLGKRSVGVYIINGSATPVLKNESNGLLKDSWGMFNFWSIATDPNNDKVVYVGNLGIGGHDDKTIFRSTDGGTTWQTINFNLYNFGINAIAVNPIDSYVYVNTWSGTWKLPPPGTVSTTDTTPPSVSITSPTTNTTYTTSASTIALSGTASDNVGVTSVTCLNNGISCGTPTFGSGQAVSWSVSNVPLTVGTNSIVITAKDAKGNTSTDTLTITRTTTSSSSSVTQSSSSSVSQSSSSSLQSSSSSSLAQSSSSSSLPTLTTTTKKTLSVITTDGNLNESVWSLTDSINRTISGVNNNTATFSTLWNNQYLYVAVKVLDSVLKNDSTYPWQDDSVEIYIDGAHNHSTTYDTNDRQIIKGQGDNTAVSFKVNTPNLIHGSALITGGYTMEFAIPWSDLGITPSFNMTIGFDLQQNDDDTGGNIQNSKGWNSVTGKNYTTTLAFGHLTLSATTVGTLPSSSSSSVPSSSSSSLSQSSSSSRSSSSVSQSSVSSSDQSSSPDSFTAQSSSDTNTGGGTTGGGGGGGGSNTGTITPVTPYTQTITPAESQSSSASSTLYPQSQSITTILRTVTGPFSIGMRSQQVKVLQQMLSSDSDIYPEGDVTGYYGPATTRAVKRFQKKYNIEQTGLAGIQTRAKLNEVYGQTSSTQSSYQSESQTYTSSSSYYFNKELRYGSKGNDVTELQNRLTSEGVYSGPITGYYGTMTREAVKKYQTQNNLPPVGVVGPRTLQLLNGSSSSSSNTNTTSSSQGLTLRDLVELLISLGVISPDKADLARSALKTMEGK